MSHDDDLAGQVIGRLQVAIAAIGEEVDEIATIRLPADHADAVIDQLILAGDDIALLARACRVLRRRAKTF